MRVVPATTHLTEAAARLNQGLPVAFPTETFYGLAVDARNTEALAQLCGLKGRNMQSPFPVLLPNRHALHRYVERIPPSAQKLIDRYWPGPLTLIMTASQLPEELMNPHGGVGFRVSSHPVASKLAALLGHCITATSANLSGHDPATSAAHVESEFHDADLMIVDGGEVPGGKPSTVVDYSMTSRPILVREGAIPWSEIVAVLRGDDN